jgi:hypothetical protein
MFIIAIGTMSKVLQRVATYAIVIALSRIGPQGPDREDFVLRARWQGFPENKDATHSHWLTEEC